jgi:predicted AlkP superfamily pyrophosphatase or phosphodiesterase
MMMTDGMRPDAMQQAATPNLDRVLARSAYTLQALSVIPPVTLPCHMSIFYSLLPDQHGVTLVGHHMRNEVNGLIERLYLAGKTSAFIYNWDPLRELSRPLHLSAAFMANNSSQFVDGKMVGDRFILEHACREIPKNLYDFVFVYWGTIDECGHRFGWMSDEYLRQIEMVDGMIGQVLEVMAQDTVLLVFSDHGGHDTGHGIDIPEDMLIPWMICGPGIKQNHVIQSPVTLLDTTPTLAHILELRQSVEWQGRVIDEIFLA